MWLLLFSQLLNQHLKLKKAAENYNTTPCGTIHFVFKVVLTFESVDEIRKCDHSNESCPVVHVVILDLMACPCWLLPLSRTSRGPCQQESPVGANPC